MVRTGIRFASLIASLSVSLSFSVVGCGSPAMVGEECTDSSDCEEGTSCFEHAGAAVSPVCMADCDLTMERLCGDGTVCTAATGPDRPADLGVCYLGGMTAVGSACTGNLECVAGSICVDTGTEQACYRACTVGDDTCDATETCAPLDAMGDNGFCQPS